MITEDYVSFETAKLLKEKGFECETGSITAMYNELGKFYSLSTSNEDYYYYGDFDEHDYIAPTYAMVLKWLREEKLLDISVSSYSTRWSEYVHGWSFFIHKLSFKDGWWNWDDSVYAAIDKKSSDDKIYETYEESCDAAIRHCLENLI